MIKVLFGCGIAVIVIVLAVLCYSLKKTAPEGKGGKAIACFVLAIVLAVICIAPSLVQYSSTSKRTVAYISKDSMTLIDESNGEATVVDLEDVAAQCSVEVKVAPAMVVEHEKLGVERAVVEHLIGQ